jgi:hypothetical protein
VKQNLRWFIFLLLALSVTCLACLRATNRSNILFLPDVLPDAQVGGRYEQEISFFGNQTPVGDMYLPEGSLPDGLRFEFVRSNGIARIYGTPKEAGTFTLKTSLWCYGTSVNGQSGEKTYTLKVH